MDCPTCGRLLRESEQIYRHVSALNRLIVEYCRASERTAAHSTQERVKRLVIQLDGIAERACQHMTGDHIES